MRLVNLKTNQVIAEFEGTITKIHNKFLEKEMEEMGIAIPPGLRTFFGGKDVVYLQDSLFQKAFKEVYSLKAIEQSLARWEEP
jgi:hypothetical protein